MTHDVPEPETLEQLVADRVGTGREMTWRQFEERAVDEESGHKPSRDTLWKIGNGKPVKIDRRVVGAVAAGLGLPLRRVQIAATYQITGLVVSEVEGGLVAHEAGTSPQGPLVRGVLKDEVE
ncbi:helix-turn-helix DNA-binding domain protein [Streptomyces phage Kromp]|uniref:Helix-turn-helix DNA-binding domain protein n=1 Tax=Streptomyces phage Kromp TaxID=2315619 RepID=A0A386K8F8_9CAUD|nr:helix-turn-helix DNA-binding domain protein [Streptomyces phage Kromp]